MKTFGWTFGWTPRTIAAWYWCDEGINRMSVWMTNHYNNHRKKWCDRDGVEHELESDTDFFHDACAWLNDHGIQAPTVQAPRRNIKEAPMMTGTKSPIFGIKLACGSQIGYQKLEDGRVVFRTTGPSLDGQEVHASDRIQLHEAGSKAHHWQPEAQSSDWRF